MWLRRGCRELKPGLALLASSCFLSCCSIAHPLLLLPPPRLVPLRRIPACTLLHHTRHRRRPRAKELSALANLAKVPACRHHRCDRCEH